MIIDRLSQLPVARKLALLTATCSLLSCLLLVVATVQSHQRLAEDNLEHIGNNLSQQLAYSATSSLVQGDKLSLQSMLKQLLDNPLIIRAAVYDVANQPVAEAGGDKTGSSFTASVTYHDSMAGYVLITLDPTPLTKKSSGLGWQLTGLSLLISALVYLLTLPLGRHLSDLLQALGQLVRAHNYPANTIGIDKLYSGRDELQQLVQRVLTGPATGEKYGDQGVAVVHIQAQGEQPVLAQFVQRLNNICKLYDGELQLSRPGGISLLFKQSDDDQQYPFQAICCAYLVHRLMSEQQPDINFGMGLAIDEQPGEQLFAQQNLIEQALRIASHHLDGIIGDQAIFDHDSVAHRIRSDDLEKQYSEDVWRVFEGFNDPYEALLARQLNSLEKQLSLKNNNELKTT